MKNWLVAAILLTACSSEPTHPAANLSITGGSGNVVVYKEGWKQGYRIRPNGTFKAFEVSGAPRHMFLSPDEETALLIDSAAGRLTTVELSNGRATAYRIRTNREQATFSADSRFVLLQASGNSVAEGSFDPNELSLVDLEQRRSADFSVGSAPSAVAFFSKPGSDTPDPRMLLFSSSKMTQVRIEELFSSDPAANFRKTRDLAANNSIQRAPKVMVQTTNNLYLAVANMKEYLSVSLDSEDDLPPVNFEINDVKSPLWLALSPPMPATTETVFPHGTGDSFSFLYVLNSNKTITVFDADNLANSRVVDVTNISETPDTIVASANGERVLFYRRFGGSLTRTLYRMNVRTGNVSVIPFERPVEEFVFSPDGESAVALHSPEESGMQPSFTFVNFKELFQPIRLPAPIAEYAFTRDGGFIVFRFSSGDNMRKFNLHNALLDELPGNPVRIGATGNPGEIFAWFDDPTGEVEFINLKQNTRREVSKFIIDGILDR